MLTSVQTEFVAMAARLVQAAAVIGVVVVVVLAGRTTVPLSGVERA